VSRSPLLDTSILVTAPPVTFSRSTWVRGTRKIRRLTSPCAVFTATSLRVALMMAGALEYLSKGNNPEAGADPWTARGASSTGEASPASPAAAPSKAVRSVPWNCVESMKSVVVAVPISSAVRR